MVDYTNATLCSAKREHNLISAVLTTLFKGLDFAYD